MLCYVLILLVTSDFHLYDLTRMQKETVKRLAQVLEVYLATMDMCPVEEWDCVQDNVVLAKETHNILLKVSEDTANADTSLTMQLIVP